jgi:hypothetical protein
MPNALGDIRDGIDQAAACVDAVVSGVDGVLDRLPDSAAVDGARAGVAELRRAFTDTVGWLHEVLARGGNPEALRAAGAVWTDEVGGAAARLAGVPTLNVLQLDDHWSGVAADAYRNTLPAQQAALTAIKAAADEIDSALNDLANAITTFWVEVTVACATLVAALFAAAVSAASGLGAPAAVGVAVAALGIFAAFASSALSALTAVTTEAAARAAELGRRLGNDTAFPHGAWPRSTTDVNADVSDWTPR